MLKKMLSYGVVAGLLVGVPLSCITMSMTGRTMMRYGMVIGYLIMLIALSMVFVAIKRHRDEDSGGVITFWPAFGLGLGISFIAAVLYVLSWEAAVACRRSRHVRRCRPRHGERSVRAVFGGRGGDCANSAAVRSERFANQLPVQGSVGVAM